MYLVWDDDKYGTGFEKVDTQHKELFNGINELLEACTKGEGSASQTSKGQALKMIDFLGNYVIEHFQYEEACMERSNCPLKYKNKAEHMVFLQKFTALKGRIDAEGLTRRIIVELEGLLVTWLSNHIEKVDKALHQVKPPEPSASDSQPKSKKQKSFFARLFDW